VSRRFKLEALVVRTVDYGESDRVVTLLSREGGKLAAFARGARASKRRFGGALEPFTRLEAELRDRPGSEMQVLEAVTVLQAFGAIRSDLACIACAGYACELARELVRDAEPHPGLFDLLAGYLALLDAAPARPTALRAFELGALRVAGLMPRLDSCARCGAALAQAGPQRLRFDPGQGGMLCERCGATASPASRQVRLGTALALAELQQGGLQAAEGAPLPGAAAAEARDMLSAFVEHHLGRRLDSRRFLDEVVPALSS
jgi:DNA repair protein RecO (recombination protein O)